MKTLDAVFFLMIRRPTRSTLFPYTTLFRSFLISLTSATVTVSTNSTRPVFYATLTPDDGTNQLEDNTNYYFQCFVGGYGYDGMSVSPASEEFNVTTNSTHRWINISNIQPMCNSYTIHSSLKGVHCRWSENRSFKDWGGSGYLPLSFASNTSGSTQYWAEQYGGTGTYFAYNFRCNKLKDIQTLDSSILVKTFVRSGNYIFHPEISVSSDERYKLNASFNIYKGTADVYINGDSTWDDLINAFIDSGNGDLASLSRNSITFIGQIYGSGAMTLSGKMINIIGGDSDDANINFTDASTLNIDRDQGSSWYNAYGKFHDSFLFANAGATILSILTEVNNFAFTLMAGSMTHYGSYNSWTFNTKTANLQHQTRYSVNYTANNSVWNRVYEMTVYSRNDNDYVTTTYENDTINDVTLAYDMYIYNGYDTTNCNLTEENILINTVTNQPDKRVRIYYSSDASVGQACGSHYLTNAYFDIKVKVVDENGNLIQNAKDRKSVV